MIDFGVGPERLLRWAHYVLDQPSRFNADANRVAAAIIAGERDRPASPKKQLDLVNLGERIAP